MNNKIIILIKEISTKAKAQPPLKIKMKRDNVSLGCVKGIG